ncbi:unnamed protein product [Prunus armeniaca]|uniref:Uncharacterized protein n=1 Tax=Prunus armeniaca TaxID=36596 RepID=A0A6J5XQZ3_PRUAR|nr:unnamed protein product [Prunus armeniaca]
MPVEGDLVSSRLFPPTTLFSQQTIVLDGDDSLKTDRGVDSMAIMSVYIDDGFQCYMKVMKSAIPFLTR